MNSLGVSTLSALCVCHTLSANAQAAPANDGSAAQGVAVTIPLELRDNFPYLVVTLNGKDVRLKFDLGNSSPLALQQHVLESIGAEPTGELSTFQGIDGPFESRRYTVARVKIGSQEFPNVAAWTDPPRAGYTPEQDSGGFLGTGLLKSHVVVVDYPRRRMRLMSKSREGASDSCTGVIVPFSSSPKWRGEAVTEARTDMGQLTLWWDTGAPVSALRSSLIKAPRAEAHESSFATKQLSFADADFGAWTFELWEMDLPGFDGFIGYDFFARHVVCVDYPGKRLIIPQR